MTTEPLMRFGIKSHYALLAMADLAMHATQEPVRLSSISDRQKLSLAFLEQIFNQLKNHGLVKSTRGQKGGYILALTPEAIKITEILAAIDEPLQVTRCNSTGTTGCQGENARCMVHHLWENLEEQITIYLGQKTLIDLLASSDPHQNKTCAGAA